MIATRNFLALLVLGALASISVTSVGGQDAPPAHPPRAPYSPFRTLYLDDRCHLLAEPARREPGKKKPKLESDPVICHIEAVANSEHMEETLVGNELRRNQVMVSEQTYVLQNITTAPVIFQVEHFVPLGWEVDSDPVPDAIDASVALFHPHAQPGEIVRLHVGLRHIKPLRTKIVKTGMLSAASPSGNEGR